MSDDLPRVWGHLPTREEWLASLPPAPSLTVHQARARRIKYAALLRVHQHWGGQGEPVCAWCGRADLRVLQFDHLYSDGAERRKGRERAAGAPTYQDLVAGRISPATGQVLCASCNAEKRSYESEHGLINTGRSKKVLDNRPLAVVDLGIRAGACSLLDLAAGAGSHGTDHTGNPPPA